MLRYSQFFMVSLVLILSGCGDNENDIQEAFNLETVDLNQNSVRLDVPFTGTSSGSVEQVQFQPDTNFGFARKTTSIPVPASETVTIRLIALFNGGRHLIAQGQPVQEGRVNLFDVISGRLVAVLDMFGNQMNIEIDILQSKAVERMLESILDNEERQTQFISGTHGTIPFFVHFERRKEN